jgi:hypothetical protein
MAKQLIRDIRPGNARNKVIYQTERKKETARKEKLEIKRKPTPKPPN